MKNYRDTVKEHFETIPFLAKSLNLSTVFWAIGVILLIFGGWIAFANALVSDIMTAVGFWMMWYGIILAFVKKDDRIFYVFLAVSIYSVAMFIVLLCFGALSVSSLINFLAYGALCIAAYKVSDIKKVNDRKKAQAEAGLARNKNGWLCKKCGAVMDEDVSFCTVCGEPRPAARKCPACGREVKSIDTFCPGCGKKLDEE